MTDKKKINPTPFMLKALSWIRDNKGVKPMKFAKHMWPNSGGYTRYYNQGNGACSGKGMWLTAGSYVGKLKKKGLVRNYFDPLMPYNSGWALTSKGKEFLKEHDERYKA